MKGDPYIRDMRHTKGHVGALTGCQWHPQDKKTFLTTSVDGTVRIWNTDDRWKQKHVIAVKSKLPGGRTPITAASFSPDGKLVAASTLGNYHLILLTNCFSWTGWRPLAMEFKRTILEANTCRRFAR